MASLRPLRVTLVGLVIATAMIAIAAAIAVPHVLERRRVAGMVAALTGKPAAPSDDLDVTGASYAPGRFVADDGIPAE